MHLRQYAAVTDGRHEDGILVERFMLIGVAHTMRQDIMSSRGRALMVEKSVVGCRNRR